MEENINVEVVGENQQNGEVVEVKEGFFTRLKRGAKRVGKPIAITIVGIGGAFLGGAIVKKKAYKQGYIDGGADMYDSHIYPTENEEPSEEEVNE